MKNRTVLIVATTVVVALALIPVDTLRQANSAKEDQKYIRRIHDNHTVGQVFQSEHGISSLAFLLRSEAEVETTIVVTDEAGTGIGETTQQLTTKDQWVHVKLLTTLPPGRHQVTLTTDPPIDRDHAVLARFQIDSDRYVEGHMVVDGEASYGDLAFRSWEKVPAWQALIAWGQVTDKSLIFGARSIALGIALAVIVVISTRWSSITIRQQPVARIVAFIALAIIALAIRAPYTTSIEGVFGGDAFNYLSKTEALLHGEDPFAADPRKGPILSVLLIPGFLTPNPLLWSRWVGVIAATGAVILMPLVARSLKASWPLAFSSGLLLAVTIDFIWESASGLANSLYAFLIVAAVALYLRTKSKRHLYALTIILALTILTRYEGIVIAAVLLPAVWWRERFSLKTVSAALAIGTLIVLIPLSSWFWSGTSGIRTPSDLANDPGLFLANSTEQLQENIAKLHTYTNEIWIVLGEKNNNNYTLPALVVGILVGIALPLVPRAHRKPTYTIVSALAFLAVLFLVVTKSSAAGEYLVSLPALLVAVGVVSLLREKRFEALVILALVVTQLIAITLILPKTRYYLQLIPFLSLFLAYGIFAIWHVPRIKKQSLLAIAVVGILAGTVYFRGINTLDKRQEIYNHKASVTSVMIQASHWLRQQEGNIGFRPSEEQPTRVYIPRARRKDFKNPGVDTVQEELAWLQKNEITYAVERYPEPLWQAAELYPEVFESHRSFDTNYGDEKINVYLIRHDRITELISNR